MCESSRVRDCWGAVLMLFVCQIFLGLNIYDCARKGHWGWFVASLLEFWFLGGILFWMGIEKFNEIQRKRRSARKAERVPDKEKVT